MFHSFIKNSSKKILFILFFFTLGCSSNAKENILFEINKVHCFSSYQEYFTGDFITINDKMFISIIDELKKHENIEGNYNLIVTAGPKSNSNYGMFFNKAILKNDLLNFYFDISKPEMNSIALTVVTHPMCLLYVHDINNIDIEIIF
ncbi:MAG: hypothetical protein ACJZ38_02120 [Candidatus Pelagibacterales bacterium]|tara:strand:- start:71 stop:511 length:441 start_codon:yes stop_codon:yes gene_type:complete